MIKGLRRLRGEWRHESPREAKSQLAVAAPKQIIRADHPYTAQHSDEMSFEKGHFLYVLDDSDRDWFVACDPLANTSGLVPRSYFTVIHRQEPTNTVSLTHAMHAQTNHNSATPSARTYGSHQATTPVKGHSQRVSQSTTSSKGTSRSRASMMLYGFVLYDFTAERNDELDARAGESIVVIAQSNEEWFVAKPIGRLGGPGLIPVSYVELREVGNDMPIPPEDVQAAIRRAGVPNVDEWKRRAAEYKASSIPLGKFESTTSSSFQSSNASGPWNNSADVQSSSKAPIAAPGTVHVVKARVDKFAITGGRYWYLLKAEMSNGHYRNLCRFYQEFYDFQIKLLDVFPDEAGRTGQTRTLPFMPGPLTLVNHKISSQRCANLDDYVKALIRMPPKISRSAMVLQLFHPRQGDIDSQEPTTELPQPPDDDVARRIGSEGSINTASISGMPSPSPMTPAAVTGSPELGNTSVVSAPPSNSQIQAHTLRSFPSKSNLSGVPTLKLKIHTNSHDVIAMRIPHPTPWPEVYARISDRLGTQPELYTSSDLSGSPVESSSAFEHLLRNGTKLALYAR